MNRLKKLYDEDLFTDLLFKLTDELKKQVQEVQKIEDSELRNKTLAYLERLLQVRKVTSVQLAALISTCDKILDKDKNDTICLNLKAISHYELEDIVQALKSINNSLKVDKDQFIANYIISVLLFEKDNLPLAFKYVEKAISFNPDCQICYLMKGILLNHLKKFPDAIIVFEKVLEQFGPNLSALAHKSLALFRLNQLDEALDLADAVLQINNKNLFALVNKGLILAKQQKLDEAIKIFNDYAAIRKDIRILTHLKNCYQKINDRDKVSEYEKEIKEIISKKREKAKQEKGKETKSN